MNTINFPLAGSAYWATNNPNVAMANFEEEKSFFAAMYVVIAPNTRRRIKRKRSRREREREASCLGRVIRRSQTAEPSLSRERKPDQVGN